MMAAAMCLTQLTYDWQINHAVHANYLLFQRFITARCTTVQSAVLLSLVVCPSVRLSVCL